MFNTRAAPHVGITAAAKATAVPTLIHEQGLYVD